MKHLHLPAISHQLVGSLARAGWLLQPGDRILDLGCGEGWLVLRLRELGFEAFGFDVAPFWQDRPAEQQAWFRSLVPIVPEDPYAPLKVPYVLPFADNEFDLVLSTQALEHIRDLDEVFAEVARVVRPEGVVLNVYPSSACCIETHTFIPFYPWFQWNWVVKWAAKLGVRNQFQESLSASEVAKINSDYLKRGVFLRSERQVNQVGLKHFKNVQDMAPHFYVDRPKGLKLTLAYIRNALTDSIFLRGLAYYQRMSLCLLTDKRNP